MGQTQATKPKAFPHLPTPNFDLLIQSPECLTTFHPPNPQNRRPALLSSGRAGRLSIETSNQMNTVIELPAAELKIALTGLGKVISKRTTLPVLEHLRVTRDKAGIVTLQATDLDATAVYQAEQPSPGEP